eukprot:4466779-Amphidinium_carterae.3
MFGIRVDENANISEILRQGGVQLKTPKGRIVVVVVVVVGVGVGVGAGVGVGVGAGVGVGVGG